PPILSRFADCASLLDYFKTEGRKRVTAYGLPGFFGDRHPAHGPTTFEGPLGTSFSTHARIGADEPRPVVVRGDDLFVVHPDVFQGELYAIHRVGGALVPRGALA